MGTKEIVQAALAAGRTNLSQGECRRILGAAGVPLNASAFAATRAEAVAAGDRIGYPVVLKVVSDQIVHKTEAGGVCLGVRGPDELARAFDDMMATVRTKAPGAVVDGVQVDEQLGGVELIVGATRDAQFGPMVMFGLGGIFVEVYKDVTFRLVPIAPADAHDMIEEVRGKAIFQGARAHPRADRGALAAVLVAVSSLVERNPEIRELDINPLVVTPKGLRGLDARILLTAPAAPTAAAAPAAAAAL
ncbi:MAG TPA: acetate--CoA ligase family protein [Polyangia bacterium]|jgi:acetyl-CoA synthetase (ADP-forming)